MLHVFMPHRLKPRKAVNLALIFLASLMLQACSHSNEETAPSFSAVHIDNADECHLCGMVINQFPGPKGELFEKGKQSVRKFCSTVDLFSYVLQPDIIHNINKILVHDMTKSAWNNTQETALIDAKDAWFVAGHDKPGAMGPTIASFKTRTAADNFITEQGGVALKFSDINANLILNMNQARMAMP